MLTLGIETSCDDTAVAVLEDDALIRANIISNQDMIHARFGGIVPELASRRHMESITVVTDEALAQAEVSLRDIDLIAVTQGPGLIGSLLVGFSYAKALSYTLNKPFVGVDHMSGHLLSAFLEKDKPSFPYVALIVSGGTTALYYAKSYYEFSLLGRTRDDAAGEAFDKVARLLSLGYPGGPVVSERATKGSSSRLSLPRAWLDEHSLDFSFSGLKTAVLNYCNNCKSLQHDIQVEDLCAAFEQAVIEVLVEKTILATHATKAENVVIGGGVSANRRLRYYMGQRCIEEGKKLYAPALTHCTDNAAMIAFAGIKQFERGIQGSVNEDVFSRSSLGL